MVPTVGELEIPLKTLKSKHGGARPGAGKPKGRKCAKTIAREDAQRKYLHEEGLTAQRVLDEIARLSFSNVQELFDEQGNLRPIQSLTREQAACIASLEVVKRNMTAGDGVVDTIHKLKVWDKAKALEMLAKHFALLTEKVEHSGEVVYRWKGEA